jgi:hypothetical protein
MCMNASERLAALGAIFRVLGVFDSTDYAKHVGSRRRICGMTAKRIVPQRHRDGGISGVTFIS